MAVKGQSAKTEAQRSQIPPALRRFAQEHCMRVSEIRRFRSHNEVLRRGWNISAQSIDAGSLPDGFEVGRLSAVDGVTAQILESF